MAGLQAKNYVNLSGYWYSGGYPGEDTGGTGAYNDWTDVPLSGSATSTYWYSDSDIQSNANSIKIYVYVTDTWNATVNDDNSITISYTSTITKIEKAEKRGNPGTTPRTIRIYPYPGGPLRYEYPNTPMSLYVVAENLGTMSGTLTLLPESEQSEQSTVYYKSGYPNHMDDPLPSIYVDAMGMGLAFKNTLPKRYVPGAIRNGSTWLSHNRTGGTAQIYNGSTWNTMYTKDGGVASGDPPEIYSTSWKNMRKFN